MALALFLHMEEADLRRILAQNIRDLRRKLHITRERLAENAEISLSYLADIEYRKTWVSDKTLKKIAAVLHTAPYQLLIPETDETDHAETFTRRSLDFAELVNFVEAEKCALKKTIDEHLDALVSAIIESNR
jgi:transcriptional regulator with XRE-family HTH domain